MARTPERIVKDDVKKVLKEMGIWYYMPVQNGMGQVGIPDFICCWKGKFLAIETKAPGKAGNLSANQERVIREIRATKGHAIVVDDVSQLRAFFVSERLAPTPLSDSLDSFAYSLTSFIAAKETNA